MTLETPVKLWQIEEEFKELLRLYVQFKPRRVLEIGSYEGGSLYHWIFLARYGARVVSVDNRKNVGLAESAREWAGDRVEAITIHGDSHDPAVVQLALGMGPFDWVFIDGDHSRRGVALDYLHYGATAPPGTVIAFHDISGHPSEPDVQVDEIWSQIKLAMPDSCVEIVQEPAAGWGGIGVLFL